MYWSELWDFIRRNMLTIVIVAVVAVAMPWTLIFIIPLVVITLLFQMTLWRVRRTYGQNSQQQEPNGTKQKSSNREGNVTVVRTEQTEQRVSDEVGEYVDFKEIKEETK